MVRQGPIPAFVHGLLEYIAGAALIAAPLLLDYKSGAATAVSIVAGVLLIFLAATTTSATSLVNQVPLPVHILLDYVLVAVLIASPFLFSFSGESTPTAIFIAGGVLFLLVSIGTRYVKEETPKRGEPKRRGGRRQDPKQVEPAAAEPEPERSEPRDPGRKGGAAAADTPAERPARGSSLPDDQIPEFEPPPRER
jgi:hypothetical protein